jgi:hypothetical protein
MPAYPAIVPPAQLERLRRDPDDLRREIGQHDPRELQTALIRHQAFAGR